MDRGEILLRRNGQRCAFLALSGGAAFAAIHIQAGDIAPGAVRTSKVFKRAITSGKLAVGAVRTNQIADRAVNGAQIADGAASTQQIRPGSVAPSSLEFPVFYATSPTGGSAAVTATPEPTPYPLADATWTQKPGEINVAFGATAATLAYERWRPAPDRSGHESPQRENQPNGACTPGSTIDSTRFRVLVFG